MSSTAIAQASFEIESLLNRAASTAEGPHVFIAGLARAGTTVLLRALYETGQFRSLTYRDMPFVLMPNLWRRLSRPFYKDQPETERAHGDRILVNADSPEAFEEVFWRIHCGRGYITKNNLTPHSVDNETVDLFRRYIGLILASDEKQCTRYLSKNNNNILRLPTIRRAFDSAVVVVPFRDPFQHAFSLHAQHVRFSERHTNDRFSMHYMNWLGHHEFGLTHRPFEFSNDAEERTYKFKEDDVNYWLYLWCNTYKYLIESAPDDAIFVSYHDLCENSREQLSRILTAADIDIALEECKYPFEAAAEKPIDGFDDELASTARSISGELVDHCNVDVG